MKVSGPTCNPAAGHEEQRQETWTERDSHQLRGNQPNSWRKTWRLQDGGEKNWRNELKEHTDELLTPSDRIQIVGRLR